MNIHIGMIKGWSGDDVALLTKLWGEGHSASQIAKQMPGRTRNSILGARHRLNLPARQTVVASYHSGPRKPRTYDKSGRRKLKALVDASERSLFRALFKEEARLAKARIWQPIEGAAPITIHDRTSKQCVWPLDIPHEIGQTFVCGQPVFEGRVYCGSHCRVAYEPRKRA